MTDLTKLTTPYGLLDEVHGPGTQDALRAHGGPYEIYSMLNGWHQVGSPAWSRQITYRVKSGPRKHVVWVNVYGDCATTHRSRANADLSQHLNRLACKRVEITEGEGLEGDE